MKIQKSLKDLTYKKNKKIYILFLFLVGLLLFFLTMGLTGCGQKHADNGEALFFSETYMKPAGEAETVTCSQMSREAALLLQETWANEYGSSSEPASEKQLIDTICFLLNLYEGDVWETYRAELIAAIPKLPVGQGDSLTRHEAAVLLSAAYEAAFGRIQEETQYLPEIKDSADEADRKAAGVRLIPWKPSFGYFSPEELVTVWEVPEIAFRFAEACFYRFQLEKGEASTDIPKTALDQKKAGIMDFAKKTASTDEPAGKPETVINQREDGNYVSQMDGSAFEHANCLPACAAMAAGYCGDKRYTGADMRNLLPEISGGWTLEQTRNALALAGVDSEIRTFSVEGLCLQLEQGNVAIVQINEGNPAGPGHCLYVYGFRRYGSSLLFLVHDPLERTDVLRERVSGEGIVMDGSQLAFLVSRFRKTFLACIP
ncbi:MAG: hypothetical protein ACI4WY_06075 [Anaerovoracaceae bacterium]